MRDSTLLYICIYTTLHSTEKMGEGEMIRETHKYCWGGMDNEVVLIQAPRWRLRLYICPIITAKGQMGEKYWACRERGGETAGSQHEETVMHLLKLLIAGIWEFAVFYAFCFLSASLRVLAHCCSSAAVIKTRDSQVNRPEQDRSKQCLNIQHSIDHSGTGTDTPICFCPGQLIADFRTEQCLDSSLLRRFSFSHNTH